MGKPQHRCINASARRIDDAASIYRYIDTSISAAPARRRGVRQGGWTARGASGCRAAYAGESARIQSVPAPIPRVETYACVDDAAHCIMRTRPPPAPAFCSRGAVREALPRSPRPCPPPPSRVGAAAMTHRDVVSTVDVAVVDGLARRRRALCRWPWIFEGRHYTARPCCGPCPYGPRASR